MADMKELYDNDPDMLKAEVARLRAKLNSLDSISHGSARFVSTSIDTEFESLKRQVAALEAEIESRIAVGLKHAEEADKFEAENRRLKTRLNALVNEADAALTRVKELECEVERLRAENEALETAHAETVAEFEAENAELREKVGRYMSIVGDLDLSNPEGK